ncbi:hypothetical protein AAVH_40303, partial [Aphelenchoides avenae]
KITSANESTSTNQYCSMKDKMRKLESVVLLRLIFNQLKLRASLMYLMLLLNLMVPPRAIARRKSLAKE